MEMALLSMTSATRPAMAFGGQTVRMPSCLWQ